MLHFVLYFHTLILFDSFIIYITNCRHSPHSLLLSSSSIVGLYIPASPQMCGMYCIYSYSSFVDVTTWQTFITSTVLWDHWYRYVLLLVCVMSSRFWLHSKNLDCRILYKVYEYRLNEIKRSYTFLYVLKSNRRKVAFNNITGLLSGYSHSPSLYPCIHSVVYDLTILMLS